MNKLKKFIIRTEKGIDKIKFGIKDKLNLNKPVIIYPYRGFGNKKNVVIYGRILEREDAIHTDLQLKDSTWNNLKKVWKRYESDEIPGVEVEGFFGGKTSLATSDEEGYFTLNFKDVDESILVNGWNNAHLAILTMPFDIEYEAETTVEVMFTKKKGDFGIISDIDDTIIQSDILKPLKMVANVLFKDEKKRVVFKGVEDLYQKLTRDKNPLFFVSGSSYNLYDMLSKFCRHNNIPKAPFIMRDLGIGDLQWIKQDSSEYKQENIEKILKMYPELKFILIGDSGEKDPEIYLETAKNYPNQVLAIYIRHVHDSIRWNVISDLVKEVKTPFLLMKDTQEAFNHAKENGWIA